MPCYSPLRAWIRTTPEGRKILFSGRLSHGATPISLPCGRCIGCRLERSRQWAVRIMHESELHDVSSYLTLTYDGKKLPPRGSLVKEDCQLFMKRLRERIAPQRVKFFLGGEYGDKLSRPHYHCILFGYDFPDKVVVSRSKGYPLYSSALLDDVWGKGFSWIGSVTFDSAMYVASYCVKKVTGKKAFSHYGGRSPEFLLMSRGGRDGNGIGYGWLEKFKADVYPSDEVVVNGRAARPPRYYDQLVSAEDPDLWAPIHERREERASRLEEHVRKSWRRLVSPSCNRRRLQAREIVARAKLALKTRNLEG